MQETLVQFLGREDPLEKGMATHASILAWRIPWIDRGVAESDTSEQLTLLEVSLFPRLVFLHSATSLFLRICGCELFWEGLSLSLIWFVQLAE